MSHRRGGTEWGTVSSERLSGSRSLRERSPSQPGRRPRLAVRTEPERDLTTRQGSPAPEAARYGRKESPLGGVAALFAVGTWTPPLL